MVFFWYVIQVCGGSVNCAVDLILNLIYVNGLYGKVLDLFVPVKKALEFKKNVSFERRFFFGYIFVRMMLDESVLKMVENFPKVIRFLKSNDLLVVSDNEIVDLIYSVNGSPERKLLFEVGEIVRICNGPFSSFEGSIESIDNDRERVKISVSILGRSTPVNLKLDQIEKVFY